MKLSKIVEIINKVKREYGDKEVKEVVVTDFGVQIIFEGGFILEV